MPVRRSNAPPMPARASSKAALVESKKSNSADNRSTLLHLSKMLAVAIGIYTCFFAWSVVHEKLATHHYVMDGKPAKFNYHVVTCLIGACCAIFVALVATVVLYVVGRPVVAVPTSLRHVALCGLTQTFSVPMGFVAAKYMNYPLYLTLKMCKMVPTVIVGSVWYRAKYSFAKFSAAVVITIGVMCFSFFGEGESKGHSDGASSTSGGVAASALVWAICLCFLAMTLDGYTSSSQDAIYSAAKGKLHPVQLMIGASLAIIGWCFVLLAITEALPESLHSELFKPEFRKAARFMAEQPGVVTDLVTLGLLNSMGQLFIYIGISLFGSLTVMALMITRKVGSVFISIAVNGHSVSSHQWLALILVIIGVVVDAVDGVRNKTKKH